MTSDEIKKKVLQYKWEFWIDRPFGAFMCSLFKNGNSRTSMLAVGVDAEWIASVFQAGAWWKCSKIWDDFADQLDENLTRGVTVKKVVERCERYYDEAKNKVKLLLQKEADAVDKLNEFYEIIFPVTTFIWLTHGYEHLYLRKLNEEVPKYFKGDKDKFIGDISFPSKKNAHVYFMEALASDEPIESVQTKFGWIKVRDGFSEGFTLEELEEQREKLRKSGLARDFVRPLVPKPLEGLAEVLQELVYFRMLRTDILYELMFIVRPILREVGERFGISFTELKNYSIHDLIIEKPKKYSKEVSALYYKNDFCLIDEAIFGESYANVSELKGVVAYKGLVRGIVKVVKVAHEIGKVCEGDILVAPGTAPSYIMGMKKAAAFVTDEGGITSHTSIIAREMKKPCVIGTKIATKMLKDGDTVEVDANTGTVKILKGA